MIKFFRQIRFKLMNENKTSKYFKYAIGEIILVVIGILIALQINNWNENRISQLKSKEYNQRIIEDLDFMIASLNKEVGRSEKIRKHIASATHILKHEDFSEKNRDTIDFALINYYQFNGIDQNLNSIEELKNSGQFGLIKDPDLRKALTDYSSYLNSLNNIYNTILKDINDNQVIEQYIFNDVGLNYQDNKIIYNINELKIDNKAINKLSRIALNWQAKIEFSKRLLKKSEILIAKINTKK